MHRNLDVLFAFVLEAVFLNQAESWTQIMGGVAVLVSAITTMWLRSRRRLHARGGRALTGSRASMAYHNVGAASAPSATAGVGTSSP